MRSISVLAAFACVVFATVMPVQASSEQELLRLKKTTYRLIDLLVEEGVLSADKAETMKQQAEREAATEVAQTRAAETVEPGAVRVTYVPEFIKDEIKADLRKEMHAEVLAEVREQAAEERWGLPGTWPEWVDRVTLSGDVRVRGQAENYGDGNFPLSYVDVNRINDQRSFDPTSQNFYKNFLNTTEDRNRLRVRARFGLDAELSDTLRLGMRAVTGAIDDPVSSNETLGNEGQNFEFSVDRAYLQYRYADGFDRQIFTFTGGRFENPFVSTDLVWDSDYSFDGLYVNYRHWFYNRAGGNVNNLFATAGAFAIDEFGAADEDKWLYAAQLGLDIRLTRYHRLVLSAAYYDYENIRGIANPLDTRVTDHTAPDFVQKGNTLFDIDSSSVLTDPSGVNQLYGLAGDYQLINYNLRFEWLRFDPMRVALFYDYVHNAGFEEDEVLARVTGRNIISVENTIDERVDGYKWGIELGHQKIRNARDWRVELSYRYLEADAVLDAYTDSDFHGGGTDAKGWTVFGGYGLGPRTELNLTYHSADEIDGIPLNIDTLQLDWISKY